ncbi:MAG: UDP-N-acetylglucosamine 1-carboxyvinyltransferase [Clostridia bacterium]|nr:UDP-N-acetylglucosamine 1-carboxyvinyltransferase [Clostridia bacterium]
MAHYVINGGKPLEGSVVIGGAKNAALPIITAAILAGEKCRIENLPEIEDVKILCMILEKMGAKIEHVSDGCIDLDPTCIDPDKGVTFDMVSSLRASYYLLGALLGRYGYAQVAQPGGCSIGQRPMDLHIKGMRALGAEVNMSRGKITAKAENLVGADIYLDVVSVGATINIMLAACRAEGQTIISNAAKEPHVVDVANFLNMMGASIKGAGTNVIRIKGKKNLHGCTYAIIPDQIEAGTYMIAAAATGGEVTIRNIIPTHLEAISAKLMESGIRVTEGDDDNEFFITVSGRNAKPRAVNVRTFPYPGFPTDLQQPMMAFLTTADGNSVVVENIFEDRFNHVVELERMGANITVIGKTATVSGTERIYGAPIYASDLRAGAALIIAALMAEGESEVHNIKFIDRGYERLAEKLTALGADIKRVED